MSAKETSELTAESKRGCVVCDAENDRIALLMSPNQREQFKKNKVRYSESDRDIAMERIMSGEAYEAHEERREEALYEVSRESSGRPTRQRGVYEEDSYDEDDW